MNSEIFNKLEKFVIEQSCVNDEPITRKTRLYEDLGVYGDDAVEFLIAFSNKFNVHVSKFMAADYFKGEGIDIFFWKREKKKKVLQTKIKQLEQKNNDQEQIIINLKNDKENLTKQLIQVQKAKENLLKILSSDLQVQQINLSNKEQNTPELHQQLIAQIEISLKN